MNIMKVFIIDDDLTNNTPARDQIRQKKNTVINGNYYTGKDFFDCLNYQCQPDLIFINHALKEMSGHDCAKLIKARIPEARIVIMNDAHHNKVNFRRIKSRGKTRSFNDNVDELLMKQFKNIVTKTHKKDELVKLLKKWDKIGSKILMNIITMYEQASKQIKTLSPKQKKVLKHLTTGKTIEQIASLLELSYSTIRTHISRMNRKLNLPYLLKYLINKKNA